MGSRERTTCEEAGRKISHYEISLEKGNTYGVKFDWRNFAETFICEVGYIELGPFWLAVILPILGWKGATSACFLPGRYSSGESNYRTYILQLVIWMMCFPCTILFLGFIQVDLSELQRSISLEYDLILAGGLLLSRSFLIAIKYGYVPRKRLLYEREYGRSEGIQNSETMIPFSIHPQRFILYDQLEVAYALHDEELPTQTFLCKCEVGKERFDSLVDNLQISLMRHRAAHSKPRSLMTSAKVKPNAGDTFETMNTIKELEPEKEMEQQDKNPEEAKANASEEEEEDLMTSRHVSVRALVFHIIKEVFHSITLGHTSKILWSIVLFYCLGEIAALIYTLSNKMTDASGLEKLLVANFSVVRLFGFINVNSFILCAVIHFRRVHALLLVHLSLLSPTWEKQAVASSDQELHLEDECVRRILQDLPIDIDQYHIPNVRSWSHCFRIFREFAKVFTLRFNACCVLYLGASLIFTFSQLFRVWSGREIPSPPLFIASLFGLLMTLFNITVALWKASVINYLHSDKYPRYLTWVRTSLQQLRFFLLTDKASACVLKELSTSSQLVPEDPKLLSLYMYHVQGAYELEQEKILNVPRLTLMGVQISDNFLKSGFAALVSLALVIMNIFRNF